LLVNGRREPIGKRALDILSVLGEAHGGIVTKDELLEAVWPGIVVEENALQVHVSRCARRWDLRPTAFGQSVASATNSRSTGRRPERSSKPGR
jgi:DNA-binding winged helix-turn-helix (wHTH) protein